MKMRSCRNKREEREGVGSAGSAEMRGGLGVGRETWMGG